MVDSWEPAAHGLSPAAALKRIDELTIHTVSRPLNVAMGEVYRRVAECDKPNRVVYVLTDLFSSAWDVGRPAEGLDQVEKLKAGKRGRMVTFVVRLTPQEIHNVSVDSAEPSQSIVTQGEPVDIRAWIRSESQGKTPPTRTVEFFIDGVKKGEQIVELPPKGQKDVHFPVPANLKEGELHRGEIALKGVPDPLEDDDRRYFTFKVRPPMKVLVVSDRRDDANFVVAALEPETPSSPRSFVVTRKSTKEFQDREKDDLSNYSCVFLLNVSGIDGGSWGALNAYVHQGGGVVVGAGHLCEPENYNDDIPAQFLPAQIERTGAKPETKFGKIADVTHPLFQKYGRDLDSQLSQVPVYRYWGVKAQPQPIEGTRTLISYADGAPALLERTFKGPRTGHVLLWTTPLYRNPAGGTDAWNEFPYSESWSFPVLIGYLTVPYMAGAAGDPLNFEAGQPVTLTLEPTVRYKSFSLTGPGPDGKTDPIPAPATRDSLEVAVPQQQPGQWTVKAMAEGGRSSVLGFSLNPPHVESEFTRLEPSDLDTIFGKGGYHLAEDESSLKSQEEIVRRGYEIFPFLMLLILIVVTVESILANTFYKEAPRPGAAGAAA